MLRELTEDDLPDLRSILQDPDVMYAYEHTFSEEDVRAWLERQFQRYREIGTGLWAVVLKETGEMIGQAGLTYQSCEGEQVFEIGYLLKKAHWHRGYATEAAQGCKKYAFEVLGHEVVHSLIKADNYASQGVARRVGMHKAKEFTTRFYAGDMLHILYRLRRDGAF
jgi:RimJ/RimL family protein N-acetyltransferase